MTTVSPIAQYQRLSELDRELIEILYGTPYPTTLPEEAHPLEMWVHSLDAQLLSPERLFELACSFGIQVEPIPEFVAIGFYRALRTAIYCDVHATYPHFLPPPREMVNILYGDFDALCTQLLDEDIPDELYERVQMSLDGIIDLYPDRMSLYLYWVPDEAIPSE